MGSYDYHDGPLTVERPGEPHPIGEPGDDLPIPRLEDVERVWVLYAYQALEGDKPAMAKTLGVTVKTIYNKLARYRRDGYLV